MDNVEIAYLADHADQVFALAAALHTEDREYYGARTPAAAAADLALSLQREALPLALIALGDGVLLGTATLCHDSLTTHAHLGPWLAAFYVRPELRAAASGASWWRRLKRRHSGLASPSSMPAVAAQHRCWWAQAGTSSNVSHTIVRRLRFSAGDLR
jgi:hypothetical protein